MFNLTKSTQILPVGDVVVPSAKICLFFIISQRRVLTAKNLSDLSFLMVDITVIKINVV